MTTTTKSSQFHGLRKYEFLSSIKPIAIIFKIDSSVKKNKKTYSAMFKNAFNGDGFAVSPDRSSGSSIAKQIQFKPINKMMKLSKYRCATIGIICFRGNMLLGNRKQLTLQKSSACNLTSLFAFCSGAPIFAEGSIVRL